MSVAVPVGVRDAWADLADLLAPRLVEHRPSALARHASRWPFTAPDWSGRGFRIALVGVALIGGVVPLLLGLAAGPLLLTVLVAGLVTAWQRRAVPPVTRWGRTWQPWKLTVGATQAGIGLLAVAWWTVGPVLVSLTSLLALELLLRPRKTDPTAWYTHARLANALVKADVLKGTPTLRYLGRPRTDAHGTQTVTVLLPEGSVWTRAQGRRRELESALRLPDGSLHVQGMPRHSPAALTLAVTRTTHDETRPHARSPLATAERTVWREPYRVGVTARGLEVAMGTHEQNSLVGGKPGYGKSSAQRLLAAQYALDPTTLLYGLDGKGSRKDWAALVPLCERWVWGTDEAAPALALAMLEEVLDVVRHRNTHSLDEPAGGWPGLLLLLEEWQDVRSGATREQQEQLDTTLGRIVRMGRAVCVQVSISTQRPSVDDVPSGVRNLITQNLALVTRDARDTALVLGGIDLSDVTLPARRGEGLLATPEGLTAVHLDWLDLDDFAAVCERARRLRAAPPVVPVSLSKPAPAVILTKPDELGDSLRVALADGPLSASDLLARLPTQVRPSSPVALGIALGKRADVERVQVGKDKHWTLRTTPRTTLRAPSATSPGTPRSGGFRGSVHAQVGPLVRRPERTGAMP